MKIKFGSSLVIGFAFSTLVAVGIAAQGSGDAARGKTLFYEHGCYGCHGFNGETGIRDLVGTGSPIVANEELFVTFLRLRADQAPMLPSTRMPNYPASSLSDADARDIFAYVSRFQLNAPDAENIPAFQAILESAARPYSAPADR